RFTAGYWLTAQHDFAVEGGYFFLGQQSRSFAASGSGAPGSPTVARPFFNLDTNAEDTLVVAAPPPGAVAGSIGIALSDRLQGAELNLRSIGWSGPQFQVDLVGGFRYLSFDESLDIGQTSLVLATGTATSLTEQFMAQNRFYGGQTGVVGRWRLGKWQLDA